MGINVKIKLLRSEASVPARATGGSSGYDIASGSTEPIVVPPGGYAVVPTGFALEIPRGFEAQIRPRSGLAAKYGIGILNSPGTIDSDYRGEVFIILFNTGKERFVVHPGERVAQMVFSGCEDATFEVTESLPDSPRGKGGLGHTGR